MQIKNFAASYYWVTEIKNWLYAEFNNLPAWQTARKSIAALKRPIKDKVLTFRQGGWILTKINKAKLKMKKRGTS
jgi:hypothetical protein